MKPLLHSLRLISFLTPRPRSRPLLALRPLLPSLSIGRYFATRKSKEPTLEENLKKREERKSEKKKAKEEQKKEAVKKSKKEKAKILIYSSEEEDHKY